MSFGKNLKDKFAKLKQSIGKPKLPKMPKVSAPKLKGGGAFSSIKDKLNPENWKKPNFNKDSLKLNKENLAQWRDKWSNGLNNISNLSFDRIPRDFKFSDSSLLYMNIAAVAAISYFTADLAATIINPKIPERTVIKRKAGSSQKPKSIDDYAAIRERKLFGKIPKTDGADPDFSGPAVKSNLPLDLVGIILVQDRLKSVASINVRSANKVVSIRVNDPIKDGVILREIEESRIIFTNKRTNRKEYIELPKSKKSLRTSGPVKKASVGSGITKVSDTQMSIDRSAVDKALGNLSTIMTQAKCSPHTENGRPAGFRCYNIVPGSIYDQIGMKNGDIICGINGEELNDMGKALKLFQELKTSNRIELCLKRNRQTMNMVYDIQ